MSLVVNVGGSSAKAVAPQITATTLEQPGKFEAAYRQWKQYELAKGSDACSFQQCFAENLIRVLTKRKGVKFSATEQGEKETDEQFSTRRKKDAAEAAEKIFSMIAPKNTADEKELIFKTCTFAYKKTKGPLGVQVNMHECKFEDAIEQIGKDLGDLKLVKLYSGCFNEEMQKELKFVGAADETAGKRAFTKWSQYADWVTAAAEEIDRAEARRGLFGMPGARPATTKDLQADPIKDDPSPKADAKACWKCGQTGHFSRHCPNKADEDTEKDTEKKDRSGFEKKDRSRAVKPESSTRPRPDSPHPRYPTRERKPVDKYAASAVRQAVGEAKMKTRRRIRDRVKQFYKSLDKGARRVTPKDLHELLASDFPDSSDTDGFQSEESEAASADSEYSDED